MRRPRVVWWSNMPTPYFVERFNAIADRGDLEFEAWFNVEKEPDRSWDVNPGEWRFRARYIPEWSLLGWKQHLPLVELRETRPDLFVQEHHWVHLAVGAFAARVAASRIALRVLPNFDTWSRRTWWREASKHLLFRFIDGAKVPGPDGARLARRYGLSKNRIHRVTQSIDVEHYRQAHSYGSSYRTQKREELGLHGCVFVYVGRLWRGKGVDYLIDAFRTVHQQHPDVSLLLLGDGVDEGVFRAKAAGLPRVKFAGFVQRQELPQYYALADVMVFPTLGDPHGLVVEEAMSAGLPVISSEAAGDIRRRVLDGETGFIVPPANVEVLADRMLKMAREPQLRQKFAIRASSAVTNVTHSQYASDFARFVTAVMAMPPRRTPAAWFARLTGYSLLTIGLKVRRPSATLITNGATIE